MYMHWYTVKQIFMLFFKGRVFGYRTGMVTVDNAAALEDLLGSLPLLATTRIPGLHLGMWLPPAPPGSAARPSC